MWSWVAERPECAATLSAWQRSMQRQSISELSLETFLRHTYLALVMRLAAWRRVSGSSAIPDLSTARAIIHGRAFRERGVIGLPDEPFYPWLLRPETGEGVAALVIGLSGLLAAYDLDEFAPSGLAGLQQEMAFHGRAASREQPPEWLAGTLVDRLFADHPEASLLDPSCGCGALLVQAIRHKREALGDTPETLSHILSSVAGLEQDPLAATAAQAAYLLALGPLLDRRGPFASIPVYQADALAAGEERAGTAQSQPVLVDGQTVQLPPLIMSDARLCADGVEAAWQFAAHWSGKASEGDFAAYLWPTRPDLASEPALRSALFALSDGLRHTDLVDRGVQGLQALQRAYEPLLLAGRFDLLASMPASVALSDIGDGEHAAHLRDLATRTYRLATGGGDALPHADVATLLMVHAANRFLRPGGALAAILPRVILASPQHEALRRGSFRGAPLSWTELWDLEGVTPVLRRPVCVLFGAVGEAGASSPERYVDGMPGRLVSGQLSGSEEIGPEAAALRWEQVRFYLVGRGSHTVWATARASQAVLGL